MKDQVFDSSSSDSTATAQLLKGRVSVVVGGGGGIGSAIALEFAQHGAFVVVVDSGVGVQGEPLGETTAQDTARRIEVLGGSAVASTISVTDRDALDSLFREVVQEHSSLDIVVHAAGILRFAGLVESSDEDWTSVFDVHFEGYLNVLSCALPIMAVAGHGRVVGLTSGSGLARTSPGNGAYGTAKRAIAALTWELGHALPGDVRVNALSPIAATRMVRAAISASSAEPRDASPHAVDLSAMPQPEDMARAATFLVRDDTHGSQGQVFFSTGSEHTMIAPPRLLECVLTRGVADLGRAFATLVPEVLIPAEATQRTGGGSNSRFGEVFSTVGGTTSNSTNTRCLIMSDDVENASTLGASLTNCGIAVRYVATSIPSTLNGFSGVDEMLQDLVTKDGPYDSIVVLSSGNLETAHIENAAWNDILKSHAMVWSQVKYHAARLRAAARLTDQSQLPLRIVHIVPALSTSGRTAAQAVAQMVRNANDITSLDLDCFSVSLESLDPSDIAATGTLVARLTTTLDGLALRGAELVTGTGWIGIRSHPSPYITASTDRAEIPLWVDAVLHPGL